VSPSPPAPSKLALALWLAAGVFATVAGAALVGIAAADSESAGANAAYIVAGPVGFFWGAGIGAALGYFVWREKPTRRKLAPLGCGCGCGLFVALGLIVFMVAIFPAL
jgi:hypothetical protein